MDTRSRIIRGQLIALVVLVISDQEIKYFEAVQYIRQTPKYRCAESSPVNSDMQLMPGHRQGFGFIVTFTRAAHLKAEV